MVIPLDDLLDKDVELLINARAVKFLANGSTYSLEAKGHVSKDQSPSAADKFLIFDKLTYKLCKKEKEVELENAVVNKDYIVCMGIKKK